MVSTNYTITLERVFQGPLDLLLHLVREQEVEIHEVEITRVIRGYLDYLKALRELDIELAGDFLVMAATLMSIKSRSLLPGEEVDLEDDLDPRDELIQRLIEYRRFKEASDRLAERWELRGLVHGRGAGGAEEPEREAVLDLGELTRWDLLSAFSRLMRETLANRPHMIAPQLRPVRFYVNELARKIRARPELTLRELFLSLDEEPSRHGLIGSFCALLELVKLGIVSVAQDARASELLIRLRPEHADDLESVVDASVFGDEAEALKGDETQPSAAETPAAETAAPRALSIGDAG